MAISLRNLPLPLRVLFTAFLMVIGIGYLTALVYLFYVDVGVGRDDVRCTRAIVHLAESARWVKTLGSYPSWPPGR